MTTIDLCVVNYNTKGLLDRQVRCLAKEERENFNLLIADNGSEDDSAEYIASIEESFVSFKSFNENIGYAAACNQLGSKGSSDLIGFLNADVWLYPDDVDKIINSFDIHGDMAIMGPKQMDEERKIRHAGIVGTNKAPKHRGWAMSDPRDEHFRDFLEVVTISGSAYFIRRSVWDELTNHPEYRRMFPYAVGAFLPTPHYFEETWISYFARHLGHKVCYDGSISIGHTWHASHPIGSSHDKHFQTSQAIFRSACDRLGIEHD